jgi:hypothetical protein
MPRHRAVAEQALYPIAAGSSHHQPIDIALSPSSSYEEVSYRQAFGSEAESRTPSNGRSHLNHQSKPYPSSDTITVDSLDDRLHLPLHHMESTEARLRRTHNAPSPNMGGWTTSPLPSHYRDSPGTSSGYPSFAMDDAKGVYEKERLGYATGKLPPRQSKTPISLVSAAVALDHAISHALQTEGQ